MLWGKTIVTLTVLHVPTPLAVLSVSVFLVLLEMELHVKVSKYMHIFYNYARKHFIMCVPLYIASENWDVSYFCMAFTFFHQALWCMVMHMQRFYALSSYLHVREQPSENSNDERCTMKNVFCTLVRNSERKNS